MHAAYPLPDGNKVRSILAMLFAGIGVKPAARFDTSQTSGTYFGVYVADDGRPVVLCVCDANLAAFSSAALSMLPPAAAKDAAKTRKLTDVMAENLREIMNICSQLVMRDDLPHFRLQDVYAVGALPAPAQALLAKPVERSDFEIALPKYGSGLMALISS
jgi:hypothetical protein